MNALHREGPGTPVKLTAGRLRGLPLGTAHQTATVMMVDLSWSMALRGIFQAAKKVALALQQPDHAGSSPERQLYIIGFSAYARELKAEELPYVRWDESVLGTNMHHALMLAQNLLAKHKAGTQQIIMISDGEPTAHLERGRSYFAYPPSPITIRETLKEVQPLHAEEHHDQHLHAGPQLLPEGVREPDREDQQGPRLLHDAGPTRRVHPRRLRAEQAQAAGAAGVGASPSTNSALRAVGSAYREHAAASRYISIRTLRREQRDDRCKRPQQQLLAD